MINCVSCVTLQVGLRCDYVHAISGLSTVLASQANGNAAQYHGGQIQFHLSGMGRNLGWVRECLDALSGSLTDRLNDCSCVCSDRGSQRFDSKVLGCGRGETNNGWGGVEASVLQYGCKYGGISKGCRLILMNMKPPADYLTWIKSDRW